MFPHLSSRIYRTVLALVLALPVWTLTTPAADNDRPLRVCASVPELGSLVRHIGGEAVEVTVFAKGTEDPHHVLARPGFIKALAKADLFLVVGMDLEIGWAPVLVDGARNSRVRPDAPGYLDISKCIMPLDVPEGPVDRSMGDVHPGPP